LKAGGYVMKRYDFNPWNKFVDKLNDLLEGIAKTKRLDL